MSGRRANGRGTVSVRVLTDGRTRSYQAQVYVEGRDGKSRRTTQTFTSEAEAYAWMEVRGSARAAGLPGRNRQVVTVSEFGSRWLSVILPSQIDLEVIRPNTYEQYRWCWTKHIAPGLGDRRLDDLRSTVVQQWLAERTRARTSRGKPYAPRTIEMMFVTLHRALRDAVADGHLAQNPATGLKPRLAVLRKHHALSRAEARSLLSASLASDSMYGALWSSMLMLGLRVGEAVALRWSNIDFRRGRVNIVHSYSRRYVDHPDDPSRRLLTYVEGPTKTKGSAAPLPLPDALAERLRQHRGRQRRSIARADQWADPGLVFTTPLGTHLDHRNLARALDAACVDAGITRHVRPHDLRHTMATLNVGKIDIRVIQRLMRHASVETTAAIYAQVDDDALTDAGYALSMTFDDVLADDAGRPDGGTARSGCQMSR